MREGEGEGGGGKDQHRTFSNVTPSGKGGKVVHIRMPRRDASLQGYQVRINDSTDHRAPGILDGFAIFINDEGEERKKEISLLDYYFYIQYLARFS